MIISVGLCNYKCKGVIRPCFYLLMIYQDKYLSLSNQKEISSVAIKFQFYKGLVIQHIQEID
jgi:hypothetical protein